MSHKALTLHPRNCSTSCPAARRRLRGRCQFSRAPPAGSPWYCATRCPTPRTPRRPRWCPSGPQSCSMGTPTPRTQVGSVGEGSSSAGSAHFFTSDFRLLPIFSEPPPPPQERSHRPPSEAPPTCAVPPCAPPLSPSAPGPWDQEVVVCIQPSRSASPPEGADETHEVRQNS